MARECGVQKRKHSKQEIQMLRMLCNCIFVIHLRVTAGRTPAIRKILDGLLFIAVKERSGYRKFAALQHALAVSVMIKSYVEYFRICLHLHRLGKFNGLSTLKASSI